MSARVDATASRVQSALTTKKVTKSMEGVVKVRSYQSYRIKYFGEDNLSFF
jgi:hypothetical protein